MISAAIRNLILHTIYMEIQKNTRGGGPKTATGKSISSTNSIKHGLLSKATLLESEDPKELQELSKRMYESLLPVGELEELLVDRIISSFWRMKRIIGFEMGSALSEFSDGIMHSADIFFRYETMLEKGFYKALHELERQQAKRLGKDVPLPAVVDVSVDANQEFVS